MVDYGRGEGDLIFTDRQEVNRAGYQTRTPAKLEKIGKNEYVNRYLYDF